MPSSEPTAVLARHVAAAGAAPLPDDVRAKAADHLLDTLAAMLSGAGLRPGATALAYVRAHPGHPEATIAGTGMRTSAADAAFAGGVLAHSDESDDSHPGGFNHPGCGVVPAALAMAERTGADGARLLRAVVTGYEVAGRIGLALDGHALHRERHFGSHAMGSLFGATAASAVLAGLDADATRTAFAYAAQQASGLACWTRDPDHVEKAFDFGGKGARDGVTAVLLTEAGFTGVPDVFTCPDGFFDAFGGDPGRLVAGLGESYEVMATDIKKWCVGSPIQAPLDAVESLLADDPPPVAEVTDVEVRVSTREAHIVDDREIPTICLQHQVALLLVDGELTFESCHDTARMTDPAVRAVRDKVRLVHDDALPVRQGRVTITTTDARHRERHVSHVRGTTANPMTRDELAAKARDLSTPALGPAGAATLVDRARDIESAPDVSGLVAAP